MEDGSEIEWPVPFWWVDIGATMQNIMLAAVNEGLGCGFVGPDIDPCAPISASPRSSCPSGSCRWARQIPDVRSPSLKRGWVRPKPCARWEPWGGRADGGPWGADPASVRNWTERVSPERRRAARVPRRRPARSSRRMGDGRLRGASRPCPRRLRNIPASVCTVPPLGPDTRVNRPLIVRGPGGDVAGHAEVVDDRVVLCPRRNLPRVRVGERPVERLAEVPLRQVAVCVIEPLADDGPLLREQQLRGTADDPGRLVDDVWVAEREVALDVAAGPVARRIEEVRRRWVEGIRDRRTTSTRTGEARSDQRGVGDPRTAAVRPGSESLRAAMSGLLVNRCEGTGPAHALGPGAGPGSGQGRHRTAYRALRCRQAGPSSSRAAPSNRSRDRSSRPAWCSRHAEQRGIPRATMSC